MNKNEFKVLAIILTVVAFAIAVRAQQGGLRPAPIVKKAVTLDGITDAMFSPSGKWTILQTVTGFYVLPTDRLDVAADPENSRYPLNEGYAKGFLPVSEKILFAPSRRLYALDPVTFESHPVFQTTATDEESGGFLGYREIIVVSDELAVSGDGDYTKGAGNGNILRFDVGRQKVTRAAQINGFQHAYLSPNKKYILYDYPSEDPVSLDLYDIERDINTPLSKRLDFKSRSPKYVLASVFPLGWVAADRFAAVVNEAPSEEYEEESKDSKKALSWLVAFDVTSGKIVWKRQLKNSDPPFRFEALSETKAFFESGKSRFEVALADGALTELTDLKGDGLSFSPDKKRLAFSDGRRVFVSSPTGANKKLAYEIPENRKDEIAISTEKNRIKWSPDGKSLVVFNQQRMIIVWL